MTKEVQQNPSSLPESGYIRLYQIIGSKKAGIPPIIPVSRGTWHTWVKQGKAPKPVKINRTCLWRVEDIREMIERPA
ncbi:MAG: helix-turn-helix domain-containing protein [Gammaproteobacteria bacterium]|nr:helix-turn-helix domain-containing protein [Gammaproteobacteria bacterium]